MCLLEENTAQKRRQAEEKEQRTLEREEKKKKQKSEARVSKAAERHVKQGEKGRRGPKRKAPSRNVNNDNVGNEDDDESDNGAERVRKKARVVNERAHDTSTIDTNQCCVCFIYCQDDVAEANGRNWIACSCGRWLHEDCSLIEPEMIPTSEEFCPMCVL